MATFSSTGLRKVFIILVSATLFILLISAWYYSYLPSVIHYITGRKGMLNSTSILRGTKNKLQIPNTDSGVPKIIHFTYKDRNMLEAYRETIQSCTKLNKDWKVVLWTVDSIRRLVQDNLPQGDLKVFDSYTYNLQRVDIARYVILYKFGGLYMDLDIVCHNSLLPSLSPFSCFLDQERNEQTQILYNMSSLPVNSAMGCVRSHPFFWNVTKFMLHPDRLKRKFTKDMDILHSTGPFMLKILYEQWPNNRSYRVVVLNATYFSPWMANPHIVYPKCRIVTAKMNGTAVTFLEKACTELKRLGFEKGADAYMTNKTVAIHRFTHLGYRDQKMKTFNITKEFPQILSYDDLLLGFTKKANSSLLPRTDKSHYVL